MRNANCLVHHGNNSCNCFGSDNDEIHSCNGKVIERLESQNKILREGLEAYTFCARERNPGKDVHCICRDEPGCHNRAKQAIAEAEKVK